MNEAQREFLRELLDGPEYTKNKALFRAKETVSNLIKDLESGSVKVEDFGPELTRLEALLKKE